jgi:hypothetical protein
VLPFTGTIANFAAPVETDGTFQRVVSFALVQADLRSLLIDNR